MTLQLLPPSCTKRYSLANIGMWSVLPLHLEKRSLHKAGETQILSVDCQVTAR